MQPGKNRVACPPLVGRRRHPDQKELGLRILALDLGKQETAPYLLDGDQGLQRHTTVRRTSAALHDLIEATSPQRVVFEICPIAGWLSDLVRAMDIELQVVNVAHDAWRR